MECLPTLQHHYHDFPTSYLKQTALDSWYNFYFGLPYLSQESMNLSQLLLVYLYCLELSLTVLQNYGIAAFVNLWLSPLKHQKNEKATTTKYINKSLKKIIIDIFIRYILGWVYQDLRPLAPSVPKAHSQFEILLLKIFSLKLKQNQMIPAIIEKNQMFSLQENTLWFL